MASAALSSAAQSDMPPPPLPSPPARQSNSLSNTRNARSLKRLSVNFPIQAAEHARHRPSPLITASPDYFSRPESPSPRSAVFNDPNEFLTALASQERRVLELKEELEKAEADLQKLKSQWAIHEATKKRNELRRIEPLRPLPSPIKANGSEVAEDPPRASREEERRKAMYNRVKQPQRKVFHGGRHTRALSLLSPTNLANRSTNLGSVSMNGIHEISIGPNDRSPPNSVIGLTTVRSPHTRAQASKGTKDDLVNTGKQLVGDLREGLWTFIEDLRQATVGDEAVAPLRQRQVTPNRASMPPRKRPVMVESPTTESKPPTTASLLDTEDDFKNWDVDLQPSSEGEALNKARQSSIASTKEETDDDGWDNWDSPPAESSTSASFSTTARSTPRTSMSSDITKPTSKSNLDQLPWPALTKLSPSNLTRTASTLMKEWERSLTPPVEEEDKEWPVRIFSGTSSGEKVKKAD